MAAELDKSLKILIVGLGLIGGSYAEALSKKGYEVGGIARREETIALALEKGFIAHGRTTPDAAYLGQFDLVIFGLYPDRLLSWLEEYQAFLKPGALLTDVTGVKKSVVYPVQEMLRKDCEFIGAHPMAGREVCGLENADARIFSGANYIVTPTAANTEQAIETCEALGQTLGFARISRLSPEAHDEMIGFLSQLTHVIAVTLMTCRPVEHLTAYTGDSFRDLTRIARINDAMWAELFLKNKEELLRQMDAFETQFQAFREMLQSNDEEGMRAVMRQSTAQRKLFEK